MLLQDYLDNNPNLRVNIIAVDKGKQTSVFKGRTPDIQDTLDEYATCTLINTIACGSGSAIVYLDSKNAGMNQIKFDQLQFI